MTDATMNEGTYLDLTEQLFRRLDEALDAVDLDFDYELRPGNVLEIEFENGAKIIINRQTPMREIWVADRSGGYHFRRDGERWCDTRSGEELFALLSRLISDQAGSPVRLLP